MRTLDLKLKDLEVKALAEGDEYGTFTGYASVYGVKDLQGDVVDRGAFAKTIADGGGVVPILWQHDPRAPIGRGVVEDDDRGLKMTGRLNVQKQSGRDAYSDLKQGIVSGLSIGYDTVKDAVDRADGSRHLKELKLHEVSLVTFPANTLAQVTTVKMRQTLADRKAALDPQVASKLSVLDGFIDKADEVMDSILAALGIADDDKDGEADEVTKQIARLSHAKQWDKVAALMTELKEGRVLSAINRKRAQDALDAMRGAMEALATLIDAADPADPKSTTRTSEQKHEAAPAPLEPEVLHSWRALIDETRKAVA